ncbi:MAG: aromatic ring-hydroxylating dioxygenase subunit alpha, partial [Alphaproteobacteria bacterium]|nr:aromatic ring-hydroxylating dioxygenase subunit alpha [Alphaproteobacteria bacterium]
MNPTKMYGPLPGGLHDDPRRSYTMASRYYTDPAIFEEEMDKIFACSWIFVGHESQVAEPGSYKTIEIADESIALVRGRDGELRCFYNVCQHRAHRILQGEGKLKLTMTCPYHAWAYDFEGKLRTARGSENVEGFDKGEFGLKQVRVETMLGLIFVNLDQNAPAFAEQYGGLEADILRWMPRAGQLEFSCARDFHLKANWKVVIDNFQECYHCEPAHPAFVDLVEMPTYRNKTFQFWSSQTSDQPHSKTSTAYEFEAGDVDFGYAGYFVWPNLTIWLMPGEPNLATLQMLPDGPEGCLEHLHWHALDGAMSEQATAAVDYMVDILQPEDIAICESVHM